MIPNDIKRSFANVDLELGTLWTIDDNFGVTFIVKGIEVLSSY